MDDTRIWPVILSGGAGSRLWPLSRAESPKQLLPLAGAQTLIQDTALRVADRARHYPPLVVAGAAHADAIERQLSAVGADPRALIVEPAGRNTAPAIALAAIWLVARDPTALMLVMPSDHVVADAQAFARAVDAGAPFARDGWLVTFGIRARTPETGYGYIRLGDALGGGVVRAERFVEKPTAEIARTYVEDGGYAWNGGIFLMRADRYLAELATHAPRIADAVGRAMASASSDGRRILPQAASFLASPSDSIDYAVMERASRVAVTPVDMGWSDIGTWDALHQIGEKDERGNALRCDVIEVDAHDCLLRSEGPLVAAVGISGVTVVATADAVLVAARGRAQDVKLIVDRLNAAGRPEARLTTREVNEWGETRLVARPGRGRVETILLAPGKPAQRQRAAAIRYCATSDAAAEIAVGSEAPVRLAGLETLLVPAHTPHRLISKNGALLVAIEQG